MTKRKPTNNQVLQVLKDCKESARIINQDADGEVRCPRAMHQIACLAVAIEIVNERMGLVVLRGKGRKK